MPETTPTAQKNNDTWAAMAQSIQAMKPLYQGLSMDSIFAAWSAAGGANYVLGWPPVQNRRVKNINTAVLFFEALNSMPQGKADPVGFGLVVDEGGHIGVKGIHQLFRPLDNGHLKAQFP